MDSDQDSQHILQTTADTISFTELHENHLIIDVRTRNEFEENSLPGAINYPLFDEEERSIIGILYKQSGKQHAINAGFEFVNPKLQTILDYFSRYRERELVISCARGGMRSRAVVNLLASADFNVKQLKGGYKNYRHHVLETVENFAPQLIVLHGLTGTGKTRLIERLDNAINLEAMAMHRSSLFGALDRTPNNQKCFDAELCQRIQELREEPYFIEGESRKIGQVFMPKALAEAMKRARKVFISASIETRTRRIIEDYPMSDPVVREKARVVLCSLKQKLGSKTVNHLCNLLEKDQLEELVRILLTDYYDKRYSNCMKEYKYDLTISSEDIPAAIEELEEYRMNLILPLLPPAQPQGMGGDHYTL